MNIFSKIKLFFVLKNAVKEVGDMGIKSGWKTSEFWITVFTVASGLIGTYGGLIPPPWGMIATAIIAAGYAISRGLAKANVTPTP